MIRPDLTIESESSWASLPRKCKAIRKTFLPELGGKDPVSEPGLKPVRHLSGFQKCWMAMYRKPAGVYELGGVMLRPVLMSILAWGKLRHPRRGLMHNLSIAFVFWSWETAFVVVKKAANDLSFWSDDQCLTCFFLKTLVMEW